MNLLNEYTCIMALLLTPQISDATDHDRNVEQNLFILAGHVFACTVILFHAHYVAIDHHTVLAIAQTLVGVEGGIKEE